MTLAPVAVKDSTRVSQVRPGQAVLHQGDIRLVARIAHDLRNREVMLELWDRDAVEHEQVFFDEARLIEVVR